MQWTRSSKCANSECVEAARQEDGHILLRDSKNPDMILSYSHDEWDAFLAGVKAGEFDSL